MTVVIFADPNREANKRFPEWGTIALNRTTLTPCNEKCIYSSSSPLQIPMENFKAADVEFQARFRHENIAEFYGALFWDQSVHLFMEAGEGGSVLEKLDSCGPMREFEIIWVTKQVLRGLEYLHSHNVIHHDIKRKSKRKKVSGWFSVDEKNLRYLIQTILHTD